MRKVHPTLYAAIMRTDPIQRRGEQRCLEETFALLWRSGVDLQTIRLVAPLSLPLPNGDDPSEVPFDG